MKIILELLLWVFLLLVSVTYAGDLPVSSVTPGYINPTVTQANIKTTICVSGYTRTIRPSASYTHKLKFSQLATGPYASTLPMSAFEEDHLISLEIGGSPTDRRNLWPQHWSHPFGAHEKDQLENYLHKQVCSGKMTLAAAQKAIAVNWVSTYRKTFK